MKKLLCLLLALMMTVSLVACGTGEEGGDETEGEQKTQAEAETSDPNYTCNLPDLNYGGDTVTILYTKKTGRDDELISEKLGEGVVSDAVYERNNIVCSQLGVQFEFDFTDGDLTTSEKMTTDIKGGSHTYDIVSNGTYVAITPVIGGNYLNLSKLEYIDTSKHYWTQGYNDMVTFTDESRQYLASGPIALSMFRLMYLTIYNKTLFDANQETDLYEVVKNQQWSLDYQLQVLQGKYVDSDGDAKKSKGDSYGFVSGNCVSVDPYMVAADLHFVVKDPDSGDIIYNDGVLAPLSDLVDKVQLIFNNESTYVWNSSTEDDVGLNNIIETFTLGKTMMATIIFWNMEHNFSDLAGMSYGIAPIPKYSAEQADYHSYVQDQVSSFGISAGVGDEARQAELSAVLEAMAYQSYLIIRPAYYVNSLSSRFMQDPQSADILDLIFNSLDFDFASSCSGALTVNTRDTLRGHFGGKKNTISSATRSWGKSITNGLKKTNTKLNELP